MARKSRKEAKLSTKTSTSDDGHGVASVGLSANDESDGRNVLFESMKSLHPCGEGGLCTVDNVE